MCKGTRWLINFLQFSEGWREGGVAFGNFIRRLPGKNEKCAVIDADEAGSLVNYCALIDSRIFGRERKEERKREGARGEEEKKE